MCFWYVFGVFLLCLRCGDVSFLPFPGAEPTTLGYGSTHLRSPITFPTCCCAGVVAFCASAVPFGCKVCAAFAATNRLVACWAIHHFERGSPRGPPPQNIPKTYQKHTKHISKTYQTHTKNIPTTYPKHTRNIQKTYKKHTKNIQKNIPEGGTGEALPDHFASTSALSLLVCPCCSGCPSRCPP